MDNTATLWPSFVTQVVSHLITLACTSAITRDPIQVQNYSGWLCLLCIGAVVLIFGDSKYLSALLDHMGWSLWKDPLWVMACNVGVFACVHSTYLITTTESQPVSDTPPLHTPFPGPEEPDRGDYTFALLAKLEANQNRFTNNRRREEDFRVSAGELPPFLRAIGEDVDDPPSSRADNDGDDEDDGVLDDSLFGREFWNPHDPTEGSPTVYPAGSDSQETVRPPDTRPRIRPENLHRRAVSAPELPLQGLTRVEPATAGPQAELEERDGQTPSSESRPSVGGTRSVSPDTASNFPLYTEYLRTRAVSPVLSITPPGNGEVL